MRCCSLLRRPPSQQMPAQNATSSELHRSVQILAQINMYLVVFHSCGRIIATKSALSLVGTRFTALRSVWTKHSQITEHDRYTMKVYAHLHSTTLPVYYLYVSLCLQRMPACKNWPMVLRSFTLLHAHDFLILKMRSQPFNHSKPAGKKRTSRLRHGFQVSQVG